jgi:ribose transport system permease protein
MSETQSEGQEMAVAETLSQDTPTSVTARHLTANTADGARFRGLLSPEALAFGFLVVLCVVLAIAKPTFATEYNLQNVGRQTSVVLVAAVGLLFVLLTGGIDLSVGGMMAFAGVLAASMAVDLTAANAFIIAVVVAAAVGIVNGILIGYVRLSPIVVTLAMGQVLTGLALLKTVTGPVDPQNTGYSTLATDTIWVLPTIAIAAAASSLLAHVLLARTVLGRYIYSVGGNETAAWLAGIPTAAVKVAAYGLCGAFAGFAGVLASSRIGSGDSSIGSSEMLEAFAAVFLGGVGFGTARGKVVGVVCGALILGVISNGLDLFQLNSAWTYVVSGLVILVAIAVQLLPGRLGRQA